MRSSDTSFSNFESDSRFPRAVPKTTFPKMKRNISTFVALFVLFGGFGNCGFIRRRRSFLSLGDMVGTLTEMSPASFVDYGLWCGFGGGGDPVDSIDSCCRTHDICYDSAHEEVCKSWDSHLLLVNYQYKIQEQDIACNEGQSTCSSAVCTCDIDLAHCLRKHKGVFDPKNSGIRDKVEGKTNTIVTKN